AKAPARQIGEPAAHRGIVQRGDAQELLAHGGPDVHHRRRADADRHGAHQIVHYLRHAPPPWARPTPPARARTIQQAAAKRTSPPCTYGSKAARTGSTTCLRLASS